MKTVFANRLSLLRQERGISQRRAAHALGVSQALLSHYENGAREPGLIFVNKACDYYNVTSDYVLGRSLSRDGTVILAEDLPSAADGKDNVMRGSMLATLHKKLVINTAALLFEMLGRTRNAELVKAGARYIDITMYKLFRILYSANPELPQRVFTTGETVYGPVADAEIKYAEAELQRLLAEGDITLPNMELETLTVEYPLLAQSLLSLLHNAGQRKGDVS